MDENIAKWSIFPLRCSKWSNHNLHSSTQVVQYIGYVDCSDYENGHGTHVGGSIAGGMSGTSAGGHFGDGVSDWDKQGQRTFTDG